MIRTERGFGMARVIDGFEEKLKHSSNEVCKGFRHVS